ncbi:hypothetical protein [Dermatobacter hominis]|uniref:hypothetical protein n=1 Tax=Dermatobacter hominis TaxID=2884263 RepID=UPI001D1001AE|nr:hypothetical protein [Dermatobacter hominis]UDY35117.1 hypothetical protein LH044_17475 [Dermatobacter hominis]
MARPQSNELRRNGKNPALEPEAAATAKGSRVGTGGEHDAVPEDNRPGHHPDVEQDQPDPEVFLARAREVAHRAEGGTEPDADAPPAEWAADPEAAAASPALVARAVADGARRLAAGCVRTVAGSLRRLGDAIDPG